MNGTQWENGGVVNGVSQDLTGIFNLFDEFRSSLVVHLRGKVEGQCRLVPGANNDFWRTTRGVVKELPDVVVQRIVALRFDFDKLKIWKHFHDLGEDLLDVIYAFVVRRKMKPEILQTSARTAVQGRLQGIQTKVKGKGEKYYKHATKVQIYNY